MTYTHIVVKEVPQRFDDTFNENCKIAEEQKMLANAAPKLLEALQAMLKCCFDMERNDETTEAVKKAMKAIYNATGELQ